MSDLGFAKVTLSQLVGGTSKFFQKLVLRRFIREILKFFEILIKNSTEVPLTDSVRLWPTSMIVCTYLWVLLTNSQKVLLFRFRYWKNVRYLFLLRYLWSSNPTQISLVKKFQFLKRYLFVTLKKRATFKSDSAKKRYLEVPRVTWATPEVPPIMKALVSTISR